MTLGVSLSAIVLVLLVPGFFLSAPGWIAGRLAAPNSPQLRKTLTTWHYWVSWALLGGVPLAASITGGPFAGVHQFLPTPLALALGIIGILTLNVSAFFIGYKHGLAAKAKKEIRESFNRKLSGMRNLNGESGVDVLDQNHPAIATDAHGPLAKDAPPPKNTPPSEGGEYPTAQPVED